MAVACNTSALLVVIGFVKEIVSQEGIGTDGIPAVRRDYSLKKVITEFAIKTARFQATVLKSDEMIRRDKDLSGPVF